MSSDSRALISGARPIHASSGAVYGFETGRRRIVFLVFVVYTLLILEGALRKWVFPEYQQALFFIRDPFVLLIYLYATVYAIRPRGWAFQSGIVLAVCALILIPIQLIFTDAPLLVLLYGWRNYFFYVPLAFVIGETFQSEDLDRMARFTLLLAVPIAVLVYIQFLSLPEAFINKAVTDDALVFVVVEDVVRTTGTFSFTAGQSLFVGSIFAMMLSCWTARPEARPVGGAILIVVSVAVIANLALSGSRTAFIVCALVVLMTPVVAMRMEGWKALRALLWPSVVVSVGIVIFVYLFDASFDAINERRISADEEQDLVQRALDGFYAFTDDLLDVPILGHGIGLGTNAGAVIAIGASEFRLGEHENSRIIQECGAIFGSAYIFYRLALFLHLAIGALKATRRTQNPLPIYLIGFIGIYILQGQMTFQGTTNGYGWLFIGFCLAANGMQNKTSHP